MAQRRVNRYARAYSYGTDGSAALAGDPISSHRTVGSRPRETVLEKGFTLPRWVILLSLGFLAWAMFTYYGNAGEQMTRIKREVAHLEQDIMRAEARVVELDQAYEVACDETRIRSLASNRLGMRLPTSEQVYPLPVLYAAGAEPQGYGGSYTQAGQNAVQFPMMQTGQTIETPVQQTVDTPPWQQQAAQQTDAIQQQQAEVTQQTQQAQEVAQITAPVTPEQPQQQVTQTPQQTQPQSAQNEDGTISPFRWMMEAGQGQ